MNLENTQSATRNPQPTSNPTPSTRAEADGWFTPIRFALLLLGIIIARFPKVVLGQETFFYLDFGLFTFPVAHYYRECFWRGELPLWNPLSNFGIPLLAQWNTSILYPPSLFYLLFPLTWSLAVFNLGHLVFAGLGMYFLARRWTGSQLAASVAGIAFAFNGLSLHMLMWISNLAAWAWMPWVVLAVEQAWKMPAVTAAHGLRSSLSSILYPLSSAAAYRPLILAALAGAMQMLAGAPELILLTWLFLGGLWLAQFCRGKIPRAQMFWRTTGVCALIAGLTAAQLLPFMELLAHSQRDTGYADSKWAMPAWGWANFLVPVFHCSPSIIGVFSQTDQQWTSSYYMGIGLVALAAVALWQRRQPRVVYGLAIAALAGVVLAMGENAPVYGWLKRAFPLLGVMRYPIKLVVLTVFALPLLAAFGVSGNHNEEPPKPGARGNGRQLLMAGILLLLLVAGIVIYAQHFPLPDESWLVTRESGVSRAVFLVLILGAAWALGRARVARTVGLAGMAILLLIALDALTHATNQNPTLPVAVYEPLGAASAPPARHGEARAMVHPRLQSFLIHAATADSLSYYLGLRRARFLNCNLIDDIPTTSGFFSLELRSAAQVGARLNHPDAMFPEPLADFAGVSQISAPDTSFTWTNRSHFMPLATGGQKPTFAGAEETLNALSSPDFNPRATVYLPPTARDAAGISNQTTVRITNQKFSAQHDEFDVAADAPSLIVVAQAFYEPWHAYVDGHPVPLWEANGAFQALAVPAGPHHVKLAYEDAAFKWGMIISLASLAAAGWFWFGRRVQ